MENVELLYGLVLYNPFLDVISCLIQLLKKLELLLSIYLYSLKKLMNDLRWLNVPNLFYYHMLVLGRIHSPDLIITQSSSVSLV